MNNLSLINILYQWFGLLICVDYWFLQWCPVQTHWGLKCKIFNRSVSYFYWRCECKNYCFICLFSFGLMKTNTHVSTSYLQGCFFLDWNIFKWTGSDVIFNTLSWSGSEDVYCSEVNKVWFSLKKKTML